MSEGPAGGRSVEQRPLETRQGIFRQGLNGLFGARNSATSQAAVGRLCSEDLKRVNKQTYAVARPHVVGAMLACEILHIS